MLIILEIILTIWAWRKGWGAKALLPAGIILGFSFLVGIFIAVANGNIDAVKPMFIVLDLVMVGVLTYMIAKPPVTNIVPEVLGEEENFKLE